MNDNDFGFTFEQSSEVDNKRIEQERASTMNELVKWKSKCSEMHGMILPLLNNLKRNPDKPNIVWPDREEKINAFITKLNSVLND